MDWTTTCNTDIPLQVQVQTAAFLISAHVHVKAEEIGTASGPLPLTEMWVVPDPGFGCSGHVERQLAS